MRFIPNFDIDILFHATILILAGLLISPFVNDNITIIQSVTSGFLIGLGTYHLLTLFERIQL